MRKGGGGGWRGIDTHFTQPYFDLGMDGDEEGGGGGDGEE